MYELLMQLPLFQGIGSDRLSALIEKYPFHFLKFTAGEQICSVGDPCTHIRFIVSGKARVTIPFNHLRVALQHTLTAPQVLSADHLFGLNTTYPCEVSAYDGVCGVLQLLKSDYVQMVQSDKVLLFNYMNYLSNHSQRLAGLLLRMRMDSITERLCILLRTLTKPMSTDVSLWFRMKDLCTVLGTSRYTLTKTLDDLVQQGLVTYTTGSLTVDDLASLLALGEKKTE